ncbi:glycohydrolase [Rhodococcus rhodnii]|uniref:Glycohydrolase n=2 Tax=Rhodococcus rhodnii TaxID=38312 RepID=R7WNB3_9NOCA|nr:ADP-ribosylglycohydrolase family protein [Rhodococcus rhodnii]EOM75504.1 glycohydrolase [Rhodococcus rhodnii LMG 5362]TXG90484.1 glycohydrolase [Rhodococcus rhodnii]
MTDSNPDRLADSALLARYGNALIGLAAGDAWGYQVEFRSYANMPAYPVPAPAGEWIVSDDTQMTLALHDALTDVDDLTDIDAVTRAITSRFLEWQTDPDNDRAPGTTCMASLSALRSGARWYDANGARESAGCGAVMRLVPTAFAPEPYWLGLTALQAVITHRHPRAIVPALLLADAVRHAPDRGGRLLDEARAESDRIRAGSSRWLSDSYLTAVLAPYRSDVPSLLIDGLDDDVDALLGAAVTSRARLRGLDPSQFGDPCTGVGEGWESASATALGLLVADLATGTTAPLDGPAALAWASTSNGDSDSIACIAGALIGSAHTTPHYWESAGLTPRFEPRYAAALATAADRVLGSAHAEE